MSPASRVFTVSRERPHLLIAAIAVFLLLSTVLLRISLPTLFIGMLVMGMAAVAAMSPEIGLHILALNALIGLTRLVELPRLGPFSAVILIEGLLVAAIMFQMAFFKKRLNIGTSQHALMGLLAGWILLSVLLGVTVGPENFQAYRSLFFVRLVMFLLVTVLISSAGGIKRLFVTFMIANLGLLIMATAVRLGYFGEEMISETEDFQRTGALLQNPNELAFNLTTMLVLTIAAFLMARSVTLKGFLLLVAAADLFCIMSTLSRSGFISMSVVLMFLFFKLTRDPRAIPVMLLLGLCGWLMLPDDLYVRFTEIEGVQDVDRLRIAQVGLAMARQNPVTGVGLGNFVAEFNRYNEVGLRKTAAAHNMYLDLSAQMGVPALLLYLAVFGVTWRALRRMESELKRGRESGSFMYLLCVAIQAAFVNLAVFGLSGDVEFDYSAFIILGLAVSLLREHRRCQGLA